MESIKFDYNNSLGNIKKANAWAYWVASTETGIKVAIGGIARDTKGRPIGDGYIAMYTLMPRNTEHGPFWARARKLLEQP